MNCKENFIEIPNDNPFANDLFGRANYGQFVQKIVDSYSKSGAVIALNGEWGSGKTTFLRMWGKSLELQGYTTLFFNAWQCDFHDEPLVALIGELIQQFSDKESKEELIKKGAKLVSAVCKSAFKGLVQKFTTVDLDDVISATTDIARESIIRYDKDKNLLNDFKESLTKVVPDPNSEKPVVFIIDELDRCNPHFSIKLLERLKHVFEVPGIVFVLGVNMEQLQYAVQGFYGSNAINGRDYLKRFFDIELNLPEPDLEVFCRSIFKSQGFPEMFEKRIISDYVSRGSDKEEFEVCACALITSLNISLRNTFRILHYTRLAMGVFKNTCFNHANLIFLLCLLKTSFPNTFSKIKYHELSMQELLTEIESIIPKHLLYSKEETQKQAHIIQLICKLLLAYNFLGSDDSAFDESFQAYGNKQFPISPRIIPESSLYARLAWYASRRLEICECNINNLIPTVELTSGINFN